jgi:hypothetical protein
MPDASLSTSTPSAPPAREGSRAPMSPGPSSRPSPLNATGHPWVAWCRRPWVVGLSHYHRQAAMSEAGS